MATAPRAETTAGSSNGPSSGASASPRPTTERVPPHDLDAEMALLGSMMMSRDAVAEVIPVVTRSDAEWFYLPAHQRLFEVLLDLYDDPMKAIDLIVVSDELRRRDLLESLGGQDYLIQLAESFADWANAEYYARIVRDKGMLRSLIRCAGEISDHAYSHVDEAKEILDLAEQRIFQVTERRVSGHTIEIKEAVDRLRKQLDPDVESVPLGLPTGFTQLDDLLGGFQPGDLVIVAGRPSMGKTAFGLSVAQHNVLHDHKPVVFFSMEMSNAQLAHRMIASYAGIDSQRLRRRAFSHDHEWKRILDTCAAFERAPLFVDDTPGMTAMELRSKARRVKQLHDIQAVYVDYLQLMHVPRAESRQVEIATISRSLKALGRELGIPIVALAQLNRMAEGRQDKRPVMSDLRESGAIEQDADVILLLHREEYYRRDDESVKNQAEIIVAKQRNGPVGTVTLHFDNKLTKFANHYVGPEPPFAASHGSGGDVPF